MSSEESVYNLVTKLCEHHLAKNSKCVRINDVKRLRAKAFKVLLHQPNPVSGNNLTFYWDFTYVTPKIYYLMHA